MRAAPRSPEVGVYITTKKLAKPKTKELLSFDKETATVKLDRGTMVIGRASWNDWVRTTGAVKVK